MSISERINKATAYIESKTDMRPYALLVLGSGLGDYAERLEGSLAIPYEDIPEFPRSTVEGHAGRLLLGNIHGLPVAIMQGRFHYYEGYQQQEVTMPIRVLRRLGAEVVLLTNACGGIDTGFKPGDLMLIDDHINFSGTSPLRGGNLDEFGPRFPDMSCVYDKQLRALALESAKENGIDMKRGVYMMFGGPQFETPAEIRMARTMGANVAGMSTVPEAIVANHAGMKVCGISCVTNMASGILDQPLTHQEVMETGEMVKDKFSALVDGFVKRLVEHRETQTVVKGVITKLSSQVEKVFNLDR